MKRIALLPALAALLAPAAAPAVAPGPDTAAAVSPAAVAEGNRRFTLRLYREVARGRSGNIFLSPASVAFALGPLVLGAAGETRAAIGRALSFPETGPGLHPALGALQRGLERDDGHTTISIANALWLNRGFTPRPAFVEAAQAQYDAGVETLDFGGDAEGAAARINHWADTETHGRIPRVVRADQLGARTRLMVTNAVYFLADWARRFPPGTRNAPFIGADGERTEAPLMRLREDFRYYRGAGFAALDLPYRGDELVMTVLLPDRADGLAALESRLGPGLLDRVLQGLDRARPVYVDLALPRLTLHQAYALNDPLGRLGMGIALGRNADFGGISDVPLQISNVTHLTFLKVDEDGTEAAAVTAVGAIVVTGVRHMRPPIVFHADHPFLFMLRDRESGAILFFGRIVRPE